MNFFCVSVRPIACSSTALWVHVPHFCTNCLKRTITFKQCIYHLGIFFSCGDGIDVEIDVRNLALVKIAEGGYGLWTDASLSCALSVLSCSSCFRSYSYVVRLVLSLYSYFVHDGRELSSVPSAHHELALQEHDRQSRRERHGFGQETL